jgi:hypothetical protein
MSSAVPLRRSPRLAAKARAKFVAARVAYETANKNTQDSHKELRVAHAEFCANITISPEAYWHIHDRHDALHDILNTAIRAYDDERAAYTKAVGNDKLHICRNIANQPIYEELLKREAKNPAIYTRAARLVRGFTDSLFVYDELIWDGEIYERFGSDEAVKFIDSLIKRHNQTAA